MKTRHHGPTMLACALCATLAVLLGGTTGTAATPAPVRSFTIAQDDVDALRERAEALAEASQEARQPLPEGQVKVLKAVVMQVTGRAQWRPDEKSRWRNAKVDDLLEPGARIRTGRRSKLALRVGQNATILVDRSSRIALPEVVQAGDTLRTAVELRRGRADVKVDRVGLTNDFSVVTPSATLAVRGTGYAVKYGAFAGTEVVASRANEMFAIELTYFMSRLSVVLSGGATSSDALNNPVLAQLFQTFGPPQIISALIESDATPEQLATALTGSPIVDQQAIDLVNQGTEELEEILEELGETTLLLAIPVIDDLKQSDVADFICMNLFSILFDFEDALGGGGGQGEPLGGLSFPGLSQLLSDIDNDICIDGQEGGFVDEDLIEILELVAAFCEATYADLPDQQQCVDDFAGSVIDVYEGGSS